MSVRIGQASQDERNKYIGGAAGDQTSREVFTTVWYNHGWNFVLRPKDPIVAEKMAAACEAACANPKIGYDQGQRNTLRTQARAVGWDLSKVSVPCECDCSSLIAVCAEAAGVNVSAAYTSGNAPVTGNMKLKWGAVGAFDILTDSKYLTSDSYLKRGDVLVRSYSHTIMVLSNGAKAAGNDQTGAGAADTTVKKIAPAQSFEKGVGGYYTATADVNMRYIPGKISADNVVCVVKKGASVRCYGYFTEISGVKWYYVAADGKTGYISGRYLKAKP